MPKVRANCSKQLNKKELNEPEVLNVKEDISSPKHIATLSVASATTNATHNNITTNDCYGPLTNRSQ